MNIKFSIIIPTWNRKKRLLELIRKIIKIENNFDKYEIIICDSNSTDGTEILLNEFIKENSFINIKLFHTKFNNVAQKRNLGIKKSKFDFIILIDDDCLPINNFFQSMKKFAQNILEKN